MNNLRRSTQSLYAALFVLCLAGCGGGGGGVASPAHPNSHEAPLVGFYTLADFVIETPGGTVFNPGDFDSWSGQLLLADSMTFDALVVLDGKSTETTGEWGAPDETTFLSDPEGDPPVIVGDYAFDGEVLVLHNFEGLVEVTRYWVRQSP